ncbi:MAG: rhodanese-like domain-containing protein [Pseudomonadota bacterium]
MIFKNIITALIVWAISVPLANAADYRVSVKDVIEKRKPDVQLVDVRPAAEFETLHIPGSINIAPAFIRTKTFLKKKTVVMVTDGIHLSAPLTACGELKRQGTRAYVLDGGLPAWHRSGAPLTGDLSLLAGYRQISAGDYDREKSAAGWVVVDVSPRRDADTEALFPGARHLPLTDAAAIRKTLAGLKRPLLIVTPKGNDAVKILTVIENAGAGDALFLTGGAAGYGQYQKHMALLNDPAAKETKRESCTGCGIVPPSAGISSKTIQP